MALSHALAFGPLVSLPLFFKKQRMIGEGSPQPGSEGTIRPLAFALGLKARAGSDRQMQLVSRERTLPGKTSANPSIVLQNSSVGERGAGLAV